MYKKIKTMITLTFNSTKKTVLVTDESQKIIADYSDVPTVKVREGYYEVMQKYTNDLGEVQIPICRLPISNTIMFLSK